ncbi:hypothetical protein HAHI6034_12995 [Hathewaya histolytica]|uniref:Uncharacterized protein n=1 Tax=Hathewaya histolytica TaxID=1498 RepID=A0A4U9RES0_HATHI|nr:hypothetical protein [Hathewaya histolytica]VTQ90199.1 Uncharacterised protein [Hathewaya histolytica]
MSNDIEKYGKEGYKLLNIKRDIQKNTGQEICKVELKALDGKIKTLEYDDNCGDEVEKIIFTYLKDKETYS